MMLSALLCSGLLVLAPSQATPPASEVRARWFCEPATAQVGEPFTLVLELEHPADLAANELAAGALVLDPSWVLLAEEPLHSAAAAEGGVRTRRAWRVASLEPGERSLAETLSSVALSARVARIQVGEAEVSVSGVLDESEDAPRALREFPAGFAGEETAAGGRSWAFWLALAAPVLLAGLGVSVWLRRRGRRQVGAEKTPIERLSELERSLDGARGQECCYQLTQLLREASDGLRARARVGLTDEEWLAEVHASLEIPRGVVAELTAVFERASRVKYGGEAPTPWALQETFSRARTALEALAGGAARS